LCREWTYDKPLPRSNLESFNCPLIKYVDHIDIANKYGEVSLLELNVIFLFEEENYLLLIISVHVDN
jgi:hypothetical protein